jgi:tRNA(Leu) C34 or U34 (ribose-2'-O)-methylase TrmL
MLPQAKFQKFDSRKKYRWLADLLQDIRRACLDHRTSLALIQERLAILANYTAWFLDSPNIQLIDDITLLPTIKTQLRDLRQPDITAGAILARASEWYYACLALSGREPSDEDFLVTSVDRRPETEQNRPRSGIYLILDNIRSPFNVGSIFRTADATRVEQMLLCGYTPQPPQPKVMRTAMGAAMAIPWRHVEQTEAAIALLAGQGIPVIALETAEKSLSCFDYAFPRPVALLLGNEELGASDQVLRQCQALVSIPMLGLKNSLNVANATAIVLYEILRQHHWV